VLSGARGRQVVKGRSEKGYVQKLRIILAGTITRETELGRHL